jgi:hypothetical protein
MEISMGFTLPRALHVVAELGVADALDDAPLSVEALALTTGTNAGALGRVLRVLSAHGVFEQQGGNYTHSPASRMLRSDHPQSMRSFVRMQGIPALWHIWEHFDHAVMTGRSAAEKTLPNGGFWGYFVGHPDHSRLFNDAMTGKTHGQAAGILAAYDFTVFKTIADIGGGNGHLLRSILDAAPNAEGVLFDLPHVIEQAAAVGSSRLKLHPGNFFQDDLPLCEAYVMMQVLHDWNDDESAQILNAIRRFAPSHARLLVVEFLIPKDNKPRWPLYLDMIMLGELTGKERTQSEFDTLLQNSSFRLDRVIDVGLNTFVLESSVMGRRAHSRKSAR